MGGQGFDESFQKALRTQSWSLYSVGMLIICLRTQVLLNTQLQLISKPNKFPASPVFVEQEVSLTLLLTIG